MLAQFVRRQVRLVLEAHLADSTRVKLLVTASVLQHFVNVKFEVRLKPHVAVVAPVAFRVAIGWGLLLSVTKTTACLHSDRSGILTRVLGPVGGDFGGALGRVGFVSTLRSEVDGVTLANPGVGLSWGGVAARGQSPSSLHGCVKFLSHLTASDLSSDGGQLLVDLVPNHNGSDFIVIILCGAFVSALLIDFLRDRKLVSGRSLRSFSVCFSTLGLLRRVGLWEACFCLWWLVLGLLRRFRIWRGDLGFVLGLLRRFRVWRGDLGFALGLLRRFRILRGDLGFAWSWTGLLCGSVLPDRHVDTGLLCCRRILRFCLRHRLLFLLWRGLGCNRRR